MAQRRLNKSLVVGLVVGLMVVVTGAVIGMLVILRGPSQEAAPYVRMAIEAYEAGDVAKLENAVKAYAQAFSRTRDPVWLVAQGQAAKDMGDAGAALRIWDRAVSENPSLLAAHEARIRMRLELVGLYGTAQQNIALKSASEALLRVSKDHPLAHFGLGIALTGMEQERPENMDEGIAGMEKAQALAPGDEEFATSLAQVYEITANNRRREKKPEEAKQFQEKAVAVYNAMIKADPESASAYLAFANFLMGRLAADIRLSRMEKRKFGDADKAAALKQVDEKLSKAEQLDPNDPQTEMHRAQYWRLAGESEKVLGSLKKAIAIDPAYLSAYLELASRYYARGDADEALKTINAGLAQEVNTVGFRGERKKRYRFHLMCLACEVKLSRALTDSANRQEHVAKAEEFYNQATVERSAANWVLRDVEGQLREAQGNYRAAQQAYESAEQQIDWRSTARGNKVRILIRLARLYLLHLRAPGEALNVLNSVLDRNPNNIAARLLRSQAYLTMGRYDEGIDDAKSVIAAAKDLGDDHQVIREARLLAMQGYSKKGDIDEVKALQSKLGVDTTQDKFRQALVFQADNKNDKAAAAFKEVLKTEPTNQRYLSRAIAFFISIDHRDEARKLYEAALAKKPDDPSIKRYGLLMDEKLTPEDRDKRWLKLIQEIKDDLSRDVSLYQFYMRRNDVKNALKAIEAARKLKPDSTTLLERDFSLALRMEDWPRAERCWEQAVGLDADGVGGRFYKGRISLVKAEIARSQAGKVKSTDLGKARSLRGEAEKHFAEAAKLFREGIAIYDKFSNAYAWLGAAEEGQNNLVEARDAYTVAVGLDPINASARRALAKLGMTYGNVADTETHLREAIRLSHKDEDGLPLDFWLRLQVENQREQKDPKSAIKRREALRKEKPKNFYNLMRLALLYERENDISKADRCVAEALAADPNNLALAWDASQYYRRRKQEDKAEKLLREMVKKTDGDQKILAQVMVARHFNAVVQELKTVRPIPTDAYLKNQQAADLAYLVASKLPNAPASVHAEAAAFCLSTNRREPAVKWYRSALSIVKDASYESQIRKRLVRVLLSQRPVPMDANKEVADYVKRFPDDPMGLLFRAELFASQGKRAEAIEEHTAYLDQISRQDKGPSHTARMAEGYYLRGQLYLKRARSVHSGRMELVRLAVRDLERAKAMGSRGDQGVARRVLLAQAYEMMKQPDQAIRELRAVLSEKPDAALAAQTLSRLYSRQKRYTEQEALINQRMNLFPGKAYWPFLLGMHFEQRSKPNEAVAPLKKACEIIKYEVAPGSGANQPVVVLLRVLDATNQNQQIIDIVKGKLKPKDYTSDILAHYSSALAKTGKTADAIEGYKKAVPISRSFDTYARVAQSLGKAFGLKQAVKLMREDHAKQGAKSPIPALLLSSLLAYEGQSKEALPFATQAVAAAKKPEVKALALAGQGILLSQLGQEGQAAQAYAEALRIRSDDLTVLNNLAYVLAEDLKRPKDALPYAEQAARLARGDANVLDTLGWCLFLSGRTADALGILLEAIDRDPELLDAHLHLAELYAKEGQKQRAQEALTERLKLAEEEGNEAAKARIRDVMKKLEIQS